MEPQCHETAQAVRGSIALALLEKSESEKFTEVEENVCCRSPRIIFQNNFSQLATVHFLRPK